MCACKVLCVEDSDVCCVCKVQCVPACVLCVCVCAHMVCVQDAVCAYKCAVCARVVCVHAQCVCKVQCVPSHVLCVPARCVCKARCVGGRCHVEGVCGCCGCSTLRVHVHGVWVPCIARAGAPTPVRTAGMGTKRPRCPQDLVAMSPGSCPPCPRGPVPAELLTWGGGGGGGGREASG